MQRSLQFSSESKEDEFSGSGGEKFLTIFGSGPLTVYVKRGRSLVFGFGSLSYPDQC